VLLVLLLLVTIILIDDSSNKINLVFQQQDISFSAANHNVRFFGSE